MNRREFLEFTASAVTCAIFPTISFSDENDQKDYELYKRQYIYQPTYHIQNLNNYSRIENKILPFKEKEQEDFWSKPRKIFLRRERTGEQGEIIYYKDGKLDLNQYWFASYLLRDVNENKMTYIDLKLLDLICAVQAWLIYFGNYNPISVVSGFRTLKTNRSLENAAKNSMHLYGKAIDFRVAGLDIRTIGLIAERFYAGGVGLYLNSNFIHLDTGGVRKWIGNSWKYKRKI